VSHTIRKEGYTVQIGGKDFEAMDLELRVMGLSLQQRHFVRKVKKAMLVMAFTYGKDDSALQSILDTVKMAH
jgi:hypothetical protein